MGIRIYKSIGYFFPKDKLKLITIQNYRDILNNISESEREHEDMKNMILSDIASENDYLSQMLLEQYNKEFSDKKDYVPFQEVYFSDTYKGLLVSTIDQKKYRRGDDLIDYYENNQTPKNTIKRIYNTIYPNFGYKYLGGLDEKLENKMELTTKKNIDRRDIELVNIVKNNTTNNSSKLIKDGYFSPKMEEETFTILKSLQIFKSDLTEEDFYKNSYPAIITYWS